MFKSEDHIAAINIFRIAQNNNPFTKTELKWALKNSGIPSNNVFINAMRRTPVITQVGKDSFKFSKYPFYKGTLEKIYKEYKSKTDKYRETYLIKKKCETIFAT